jgi:ribosomal protein L11 methyltransferase
LAEKVADTSEEGWLEVALSVPDSADIEALSTLLQTFAADDEGIAIEQWGDPDDLRPDALLPTRIVKLFVRQSRATAEWQAALSNTLREGDFAPPRFTPLVTEDWANAWKSHYGPLHIGRNFLILPGWLPLPDITPETRVITLDPGMAFGTGTHATTRLCLEALETWLRPGQSVLDLGTGSGILAIGAALLGAGDILALDNDPLAVQVAQENVALNGGQDRIRVAEGSLAQAGRTGGWDVVVANILAPVLMEMLESADLLHTLTPAGTLILSGILQTQNAAMHTVIAASEGVVQQTLVQDDWVALVVQRQQA